MLVLLASCATPQRAGPIQTDAALQRGHQAWLASPRPVPRARPNVVLIVADDLGRADVSMYPQGRIATPNLDRLAADGVAYGAGYVTAALCSPSRAGLLTGRYQERFGHEGQPHDRYPSNAVQYVWMRQFMATDDWRVTDWNQADDVDQQGLPPSELTLADLLHHQGYATGMFGKWHLGWTAPFQPRNRGFDTFEGFYEAYSLYAAPADRDDLVNQHLDEFSDHFIWNGGRTGKSTVLRDGVEVKPGAYLTDEFTDQAISFIDAHRQQPFFVYLPYQNPHTPFQVKKADYDAFPDEPDPIRRTYLALVRSLDTSVGRVLDALDARGLRDDTLVIFISDNGGALYTHATTNAPFQGGKFTLFEGGLRVPYAMRWPARLPSRVHYDEPVSALDIVTTVAAAAGLELPADRPFDGVDLAPFVRGEKPGVPHQSLFWRAGPTSAIRRGPLKLIRDGRSNHVALFDLLVDPSEHVDLAASRPADVAALSAELDAWSAQCRAPLWPEVMQYRFVDASGREWWYPL